MTVAPDEVALPTLAVIVVVPLAIAVTSPVELTVATEAVELFQVNVVAPLELEAESWVVAPMLFSVAVPGLTVTVTASSIVTPPSPPHESTAAARRI